MKKRLSLLLACLILAASGCTQPTGEGEETTTTAPVSSEETAEVTTARTEAAETTTTAAVTENLNEPLTIEEIGINNIPDRHVKFLDGTRVIFDYFIHSATTDIISDKSLQVTGNYEVDVRNSSNALYTEDDSFTEKNMEFYDYSVFTSPYEIEWGKPVINFKSVTKEKALTESVEFSYKIKDRFQVNAFIKNVGDGAEIVIDPAYMYNIPLFTDLKNYKKFDINGINVTADTLRADCTYGKDSDRSAGEDYVYATVYLSDFTCRYNTKDGYKNTAVISNVEVISENTADIIENAYFVMDENKDPEMNEVYTAIVNNFDTILTESTYGIKLLDMDFDGKPEVLVSKITKMNQSGDIGYLTPVDVDIYRVKEGELKYIDTLYQYHYITDMFSNILGLKRLDNGERYWHGISRTNRDGKDTGEHTTDYLYTLNGDKLVYKEAFCAVVTNTETTESGWTNYSYNYYLLGEKIVPEVTYGYDPYYDPDYYTEEEVQPDWAYLSWNGINATFGMWELAGFIRADFCNDIKEIHNLYSDWLISKDGYGYYDMGKVNVTKRSAAYKVAYDVDKFYYGGYDSENQDSGYGYWFLGAYAKPVIYLYPEEETEVSVEVEFAEGGDFTCTYPEYGEGWKVTAMPDGTLYDEDGNEYYCLYWEGDGKADFDMSEGFCVKGSDTAAFLREKLTAIGLTAREANEFIIYWLPIMEDNEYNVITFHIDDYIKSVPMTVTPTPDTEIRVFMTFAPSESYVEIDPQELPSYERNGFTVVEWGGGECEMIFE